MGKRELPTLIGKTVALRPPQPEDAAARLALGSDAEIVRMYGDSLSDVRPMTLHDATRWVSGLQKHDHAWIIEAGSVIGHICLDRVDFRDRKACLAIGIDDPARLRKGFGSEAIMLVQGYAFQQLGLHCLSVRVIEYNRRAIRAYQKCGFRIEGREREAAYVDGQWHDDVMMGILDREYVAIHSPNVR